MIRYKVNSKIFETEQEARDFSKDLQAYGGIGGWSETNEPTTHRYLGNLETEPYNELDYYIAPYEMNIYCAECTKKCTMACDIMKRALARYEEEHNGKEQRGDNPCTEKI